MNSDVRELDGRDPHVMLGLQPGASQQEVTRAFRRSAVRGAHPDAGGDSQAFRQLTRARDILLDERRLTAYNAAQQTPAVVRDKTPSTTPREHARPSSLQREPEVEATMTPLTIVTVLLAFLGPLAWPAALVTGHLALRRIKRSGQRGHSVLYVAMAFLHVVSFIAIPGLLTFALVSFA